MTDNQLELHREITLLINTVMQYIRVVENMDRDDPLFVRAVVDQIRMESQLRDLLITCQEVL